MLSSPTLFQSHQRLRSQIQLYNIYDNSIPIHVANSLDSKYNYINSNDESVNKLLLILACNYLKQTNSNGRAMSQPNFSFTYQCQPYPGDTHQCSTVHLPSICQYNTWSCIYSTITTCYYCSRVIKYYELLSLPKLLCTQLCP